MYDSYGRLLMQVKRSGNRLYKIYIDDVQQQCLIAKEENEAWLWHKRLGHVNFDAMKLMSRNHLTYGLPVVNKPEENCHGCLMSKQARKSFPSQTDFTATVALELLHMELCGLSLLSHQVETGTLC